MATYTVERSTSIQAPAATIQALLEDFHAWREWSPWDDLDPDLQRTYGGPEKGVGARYSWTGNRKAGSGTMRITEAGPGGIVLDLVFEKPFRSSSVQRMTLVPQPDDSTTVTWHLDGELSGFSGLMGRLVNFDKVVGPDFEKGLARLKAVAEGAG